MFSSFLQSGGTCERECPDARRSHVARGQSGHITDSKDVLENRCLASHVDVKSLFFGLRWHPGTGMPRCKAIPHRERSVGAFQ